LSDNGKPKNSNDLPPALANETIEDLKVAVIKPAGGHDAAGVAPTHTPHQELPASPGLGHYSHKHAGMNKQEKQAVFDESEDELATFFRYRRLAAQRRSILVSVLAPVGKSIVVALLICSIFVLLWNYATMMRVKFQSVGMDHLQINLAEVVPAWTKKSKKFKELNTTELAQFNSRGGRTVEAVGQFNGDPFVSWVLRGYWVKVERAIMPLCKKWEVSGDCSRKAWYLAYKGLRASLRPISNFDMAQVQKLPKMEQVILLFAMSQSVMGQRSDELFDLAMKLAAGEKNLQVAILDARLKGIVRDNQQILLARTMSQAEQLQVDSITMLKWRILEYVVKYESQKNRARTTLDLNVRKGFLELIRSGVLKADPVALVLVANTFVRIGMAKELAPVTEAVASQESPKEFDPNLYREISIASIRMNMLRGQLGEAMKRASVLQTQLGRDAVSSHLMGSALLATKNQSSASEAVTSFQAAITGQNLWQSHLGHFLALTRSAKLVDAAPKIPTLQRLSTPANSVWVKMAIAEYNLARAKKLGQAPQATFKAIANQLAPIYASHPSWPTLAEIYSEALLKSGQAELSQKVRTGADQLADRIRYVASEEFLVSPLGPYALMR
jgi:hypothetical protein